MGINIEAWVHRFVVKQPWHTLKVESPSIVYTGIDSIVLSIFHV